MIDKHLAGNLNRIALHRASLAQLEPEGCVKNAPDRIKQRLLAQIAELEAVNAFLAATG
jgi:hypothetical protein